METYFYMTSAKWAKVILRERRLKLSRFNESNDPFELNLIDSRDQSRREIVRMLVEHHNKNTGMICFGKTWQNPVMWAHYAEKHKGVCLGFSIASSVISEVNYTDRKIDVDVGLYLPSGGLSADLIKKTLLTKSTAWQYEAEWRVLAQLETPDPSNGLYYTDFAEQLELRSVIIGYRCSWTPADVVSIIGHNVTSPVRIFKARPAFGRFEMVEQHAVRSMMINPIRTLKASQ